MQRFAVIALGVLVACSGGGDVDHLSSDETPVTTSTTSTDAAGRDSLGDPIVPGRGNAGYDVDQYTIRLDVGDDLVSIDADATIDATATADLRSFSLDLTGPLTVDELSVNGTSARFDHDDPELHVTPDDEITSGERFIVDVEYHGTPEPIRGGFTGSTGWHTTADVTWVMSQPHGAATWFPANDHPSDKARFRFEITTPADITAVANGELEPSAPTGDTHTWVWEMDDPMATYLATVVIDDDLTVVDGGSIGDVHLRDAVTDDHDEGFAERHAEMIEFFEPLFGPFPFDEYGVVTIDASLGLALEAQTFSLFDDGMLADWVLAHELAHQWFGDSVTPQRWSDVWLNEGFASYGSWLWQHHTGELDLDRIAADVHARARRSGDLVDLAHPPADRLLDQQFYDRGALALHALRLTVGDDAFFDILREWTDEHRGGNATVDEFVDLAGATVDDDLTGFFADWLGPSPPPPLP